MKLNQQTRKIGLIISSLFLLSLAACEENKEVAEVKTKVVAKKGPATGVLSDGNPISGVAYSTASGSSGITDAQGVFHYQHGDNIRFKIGELVIADIPGLAIVSPIDLAAGNGNKLKNLLVLLQSLDSDDDATNGISISSKVANAIKSSINLESDPTTFSNNAALKAARDAAELSGDVKSLEEASEQFLARGINLLSSHIWVKYDNQSASVFQIADNGSGEYLHGEATADDSCDENRVCGELVFRAGVEYGNTRVESFDTRGFKLVGSTSIDTNLRAGLSHPRPTWRINTDGDELIISDIVVAQRERQQSSLFGELFHIAKPIELSSDDEPIATEVRERRYSKMDNVAQGLVGAWSLDKDTVNSKLFLFFPNNRFMLIDPTGQTIQSEPLDCGKPGIEYASYSYDGASKALKISSFIFDTNACAGLSGSSDKSITFDISSDGNTATLTKEGQAAVKVYRVSN